MGNDDHEMAEQLARIIRRVKHSMSYRGSYSTRDILGSLVARWVGSGEWERLRLLAPEQRHLGQSVRRFILDRLAQLRRRGHREDLTSVELPDEAMLAEMVELADLRRWIVERISDLERDVVDPRVRIPLAQPRVIGRILRMHLAGQTQREIAAALDISLGAVNKRLADGTSYLILVQGIERGVA